MPIIEYNKTTKAIRAAHYGMVWDASDWTNYESENSGQAVVHISDDETTTHRKYLQINDGVGTLHDTTLMSIWFFIELGKQLLDFAYPNP